jgi:hypothetical protein
VEPADRARAEIVRKYNSLSPNEALRSEKIAPYLFPTPALALRRYRGGDPGRRVDEEIKRRWMLEEGTLLLDTHISVDLQNKALDAWLSNAPLREELTRRFKGTLALWSIAREQGLTPDLKTKDAFLAEIAANSGESLQSLNRRSPSTRTWRGLGGTCSFAAWRPTKFSPA